jgi:U3 small nucleolar RNA-associated protein 24
MPSVGDLVFHLLFSLCRAGIPCVTDCVMAELEKLGQRYRLALRYVCTYSLSSPCLSFLSVARDPRFERLSCSHNGTYADDCLVQRVTANRCFIVATCDRELRRRIHKIPGVPLMYIVRRRYAIERLPDQGALI